VFLWWCQDSPNLSRRARDEIGTAETVYVSLASAWETAIKVGLGKLRFEIPSHSECKSAASNRSR
jgi:PIN domain nuclease of toxin-antitoxin system